MFNFIIPALNIKGKADNRIDIAYIILKGCKISTETSLALKK